MSLAPAASLTLGNLRYDTHLADTTVALMLLPGINRVRAVLPAGVEISAAPGDDASLDLDGGEGKATVVKGTLRTLRRGYLATEVMLADGSADLAQLRPRATYQQQAGKEVINALAGDAGVDVGTVDIDLPLAAYVAHQGRTAAEHVAYLAGLGGGIAGLDADGALNVPLLPGAQPELALRYGREIICYEVQDAAAPAARRVIVGSGPAGSPDAPDALQPGASALPGGAPAPGKDAIWRAAPVLRTPAAALTATQAADAAADADAQRVYARCFLLPALRPGMVIEVQDLPDGLAGGPWMLTRVTHRLQPGRGGGTVFEGVTAGASGGLGGLLGAALAAVGGLL